MNVTISLLICMVKSQVAVGIELTLALQAKR